MSPTRTLALAIITALVGCGAIPERMGSRVAADYGAAPTEAQGRQMILEHLAATLRDPDSLKQFRVINGPEKIAWRKGEAFGGGYDAAWLFCYEYNSKNIFGGYNGLMRDRLVVKSYGGSFTHITVINWFTATATCGF